MEEERTYFTWPDSALAYDCSVCGECCRGLGIGLDAAGGQVARLVEAYPTLATFLRKRGTTWTAFNPRGRCWFLDDEGLCRVEREHGRQVKPASCRLFPFNRVFRLGGTLIVDYNSVICPLRIAEAEGGSTVTHAQVLADIESIADAAVIGTQLRVTDPESEGRAFAEREGSIAAVCFEEVGKPSPSIDAVWAAQCTSPADFDEVNAEVAVAKQALLGAAWQLPSEATLKHAVMLTPSLRFNELFGPRRYVPRSELDEALPRMWLAWISFLAEGSGLAGRPLVMQEATSIWGEQVALAYLLARWRDRPALSPGPVELPAAGESREVIARFGEACIANRRRERTLGELITPLLGDGAPAERVAVARLIEPLLAKLQFGDDPSAAHARRPRTRRKRRRR